MKSPAPYDYRENWSSQEALGFFKSHRNRAVDIYDSERYFLDRFLKPDMTVLDFGCAAGGFLSALSDSYGIAESRYCGVDIAPEMIRIARSTFPGAMFRTDIESLIQEGRRFDFTFSFGVIHMNLDWREILCKLYRISRQYLVFDLRIAPEGDTVEDIDSSYQVLKFFDGQQHAGKVPYVVIGRQEADRLLGKLITDGDEILSYGYLHPVSDTVVSPYRIVRMTSYCIIRNSHP